MLDHVLIVVKFWKMLATAEAEMSCENYHPPNPSQTDADALL